MFLVGNQGSSLRPRRQWQSSCDIHAAASGAAGLTRARGQVKGKDDVWVGSLKLNRFLTPLSSKTSTLFHLLTIQQVSFFFTFFHYCTAEIFSLAFLSNTDKEPITSPYTAIYGLKQPIIWSWRCFQLFFAFFFLGTNTCAFFLFLFTSSHSLHPPPQRRRGRK